VRPVVVAGLLVLLFPGGRGPEADLLLLLRGMQRRLENVRRKETSSENFGVGERSKGHLRRLEVVGERTVHEDGGKRVAVMQRFEIGVRERGSRCRVVEADRPAGRTLRSAGEGGERCLGRSAGRRIYILVSIRKKMYIMLESNLSILLECRKRST
jgi:hypothetical protein